MYVVQLWPSTCTPCPRTTTTFFVLVHLLQLVSWSYLAISVRNVAVLANVIQIWCLCMKRKVCDTDCGTAGRQYPRPKMHRDGG